MNLQASPLADTARVEEDVAHALYTYINPLVGGNPTGPAQGWAFGRALNQGELYGVVHAVDGVEFVKILRIYETNLADRGAVLQARRQPHRARARRAAGLGAAHRQGHAPGGVGPVAAARATARGGDYKTFMGAGFGTLMVQLAAGTKETPTSASSRAYLRDGLPSLYAESDFGMRFVGALETLLDPIVAMLDALPEHFDPDYAPRDILNLLSAWLGRRPRRVAGRSRCQRDTIRRAAELGRRRGTKGGLELALSLAFPGRPAARRGRGRASSGPPTEDRVESKPPQIRRVLRQARHRGRPSRHRTLH